jgi:predicted transcriptional regulator
MKNSLAYIFRKYFMNHFRGKYNYADEYKMDRSLIRQNTFSRKALQFLSDIKVKDLVIYDLPIINANEVIIDSLKFFQSPFKLAVLVKEGTGVVGTLNLKDVIVNLNTCQDLKSGFCWDVPVRCIIGRVFVPLETDAFISDTVVDLLNCNSLIHPVYEHGILKGILQKESILDLLKIQMLEEAVLI